jgi:hypothetical protein
MDKWRPRVEVITIGDVARARGVPVERLLEDMCRNALMFRNGDGSYAPTNYAIQTGGLVFVGYGAVVDGVGHGGGGSEDDGDDDEDRLGHRY